MKTIWIKENPLNKIFSGEKTVEGRLNIGLFKELKVNEVIILSCKTKNCKVKIINIEKFNNFNELFCQNSIKNVLPSISALNKGIEHYNKIYSKKNIYKFGVLALHIELI
jgi:ASC-1-like (ASCH) protein